MSRIGTGTTYGSYFGGDRFTAPKDKKKKKSRNRMFKNSRKHSRGKK